jgi:hypothetical protein
LFVRGNRRHLKWLNRFVAADRGGGPKGRSVQALVVEAVGAEGEGLKKDWIAPVRNRGKEKAGGKEEAKARDEGLKKVRMAQVRNGDKGEVSGGKRTRVRIKRALIMARTVCRQVLAWPMKRALKKPLAGKGWLFYRV